jgi:hypothetical protein
VNDLAKALQDVLESWAPFQEATLGYKATLEREGMRPEDASRCAADFHGYLMESLLSNLRKTKEVKS